MNTAIVGIGELPQGRISQPLPMALHEELASCRFEPTADPQLWVPVFKPS